MMAVVNDDDDDGEKLWPRGILVTRIRDHPVDCGKNEGQKLKVSFFCVWHFWHIECCLQSNRTVDVWPFPFLSFFDLSPFLIVKGLLTEAMITLSSWLWQ